MASNMTVPLTIAQQSSYNYIPSFSVGIVLLSIFAISTMIHIAQAIYHRPMWWAIPTFITGGVGEIIGWSARVWSSKAPLLDTPFMMQITTTIISPTFLLAANFIITGRLIARLGSEYSRLKPRLYTIIFCTCDAVALVVQAVGGATASSANDQKGTKLGANIMLGGIIFQLIAITVYTVLTSEFIIRYFYQKPFAGRDITSGPRTTLDSKLQLMLGALVLSTTCMFIRAIYRTIELADGWNGRIISTELYFLVLDGGMIAISMVVMNLCHPGLLLRDDSSIPKSSTDSLEMAQS